MAGNVLKIKIDNKIQTTAAQRNPSSTPLTPPPTTTTKTHDQNCLAKNKKESLKAAKKKYIEEKEQLKHTSEKQLKILGKNKFRILHPGKHISKIKQNKEYFFKRLRIYCQGIWFTINTIASSIRGEVCCHMETSEWTIRNTQDRPRKNKGKYK